MKNPDAVEFKSVSDDPWRWEYRTAQYRKREGAFKKPYTSVGSHGEYSLLLSDHGGGFYDMIAVTDDDMVVGSVFFGPWNREDVSHIEGAVEVDPRYRRKGLASAMYVAAEAVSGKKLKPAKSHTPLAEALWKGRSRGFGDGKPVSENPPGGQVVSEDIPGWLKKVLKDRGGKVEEAAKRALGPDVAVDWPVKLGCGHYGCAWGILEPSQEKPRYVVKVTRDPTEGPMQAKIAERQKRGDYGFEDGFSIVRGVYRLEPDVEWRGKTWPVYAVVREEVRPITSFQSFRGIYGPSANDKVEGIYPPVTQSQLLVALNALHDYKSAVTKWYAQKALKRPKQHIVDDLESKMSDLVNVISTWLPTVGTVMGIMQDEGTPLRDVHANNVGVRRHPGVVMPEDPEAGLGYALIFDPGHMTQSDDEAERGIARMNPGAVEMECGHWDVSDPSRPDQCSACSGQRTTGKLPSTLAKGKPFEVTLGGTFGGTTLFVSKDPQSREWRVTRFVGGKPRGHFVVGLWEDAVAEVEQRYWTEDLSGAKSSGWSMNPPDDDFTYSFPEEHLSAAANPAKVEKAFHDAFGVPFEAHLSPVWPKERKKYERKVRGPKELAEYMAGAGDIPQEQFMVALLDQRGGLIGVVIVSRGTLNAAEVHPREVFAAAIAARAVGIIGIHNHPSGDVTPSAADVDLSHRLSEVGDVVGIPLYDHIVLGRGGEYTSLASTGQLREEKRARRNRGRRA